MHTVMVLGGGLALLGVCLFLAKVTGGSNAVIAKGALVFLPLWLICAAVNLWMGTRAGYTVREELPIFGLIFVLPAAAALGAFWYLKSH